MQGIVVKNTEVSKSIKKIIINIPQIALSATSGQFVSVLCQDLIIRRPFSIAKAERKNIEIIYKIKGKGTEYISSLTSNEEVSIIGPLGNGFNITHKKSLLIGAGVGIAPLLFLSDTLDKKEISYTFLSGFQTLLNLEKINQSNFYNITEDGSSSIKGRINDYTEEYINKHKPEKIYVCGPKAVMDFAISKAIEYNIEVEASLERDFACGIGVCRGCTIQINQEGSFINKTICKDGPVFDGRLLV